MDLGTTISRLRAERHMSQGDLAEALEVSRQSISKWETNASVPELDKLVKLSRLFGVSLDELVTGEAPPPPEPPPAPEPPPSSAASRQPSRHALLFMAFLVWLLLTMQWSPLKGLILALPFLVCAVICLVCRRRIGLFCGWAVYLFVEMYVRWATSITWQLVLMTPRFTPSMNYTRLAIAYCQLLAMLAMFFLTIHSFRSVRIDLRKRKNALLLAGGWAGLAALHLLKNWGSPLVYQNTSLDMYLVVRLLLAAGGVLLLALFAALLTATVCALRSPRQKKT